MAELTVVGVGAPFLNPSPSNWTYMPITRNERYRRWLLAGADALTVGADIGNFQTVPDLVTPDNELLTGGSNAGVLMNEAGTRVYITDDGGDHVECWTMSTPYLVSSATITNDSADLGRPWDCWLKPDETRVYTVDAATINEYTMDAGDTTSMSLVDSFDVGAVTSMTLCTGIWMNPAGDQIIVSGTPDSFTEIALGTAWDLTTAALVLETDIDAALPVGETAAGYGCCMDPSGTRLYVVGHILSDIHQFNLSTAFDTSTAVFNSTIELTTNALDPFGIFMLPDGDGESLYLCGQNGSDKLYQLDQA